MNKYVNELVEYYFHNEKNYMKIIIDIYVVILIGRMKEDYNINIMMMTTCLIS